jgi:hypothetical protein
VNAARTYCSISTPPALSEVVRTFSHSFVTPAFVFHITAYVCSGWDRLGRWCCTLSKPPCLLRHRFILATIISARRAI